MTTAPIPINSVLSSRAASRVLSEVVLDQYLPRCRDDEYGGFLVEFDGAYRPTGAHRKTLEHASRTTLAFALLHRARPEAGFGTFVQHGIEFLTTRMWDDHDGGFFAVVERDGTPAWDGLKHPHGVTYTLRAIALAGSVIGIAESERLIRDGMQWMNDVAWNDQHGGYSGTFRRNNIPYGPSEKLPTDYGDDPLGLPPGKLEMNTQSDALHMLFDVVSAAGFASERDRLELLLERILGVVQPNGVLPYLLLPDWTPTPTPARTGHQLQTVRRFLDAGRLLDRGEETFHVAHRMASHALMVGSHPDGGFPLELGATGRMWTTVGSVADDRQWWVQLEALDAFSLMAEHPSLSPDERTRFALARDRQWSLLTERFFDARYGGIHELATPSTTPSATAPRTSGRGLVARVGARAFSEIDKVGRQVRHAASRAGIPRFGASTGPDPERKLHGWKDISHEVAVLLDLSALGLPER